MATFDLAKHNFSTAAEQGYTFSLKTPTGADSGAKLTILGELSPTVKAYSRKKFAEYQQRQVMLKRKGKEDEQMSLEEAEEMAVENALVRLIGWEGVTDDGKEVKFSKEKAREVLTNHTRLLEQIISESQDVLNFQPATLKV